MIWFDETSQFTEQNWHGFLANTSAYTLAVLAPAERYMNETSYWVIRYFRGEARYLPRRPFVRRKRRVKK